MAEKKRQANYKAAGTYSLDGIGIGHVERECIDGIRFRGQLDEEHKIGHHDDYNWMRWTPLVCSA